MPNYEQILYPTLMSVLVGSLAACGGGQSEQEGPQSALSAGCSADDCRREVIQAAAEKTAIRNNLVRTAAADDTVDLFGNPGMTGPAERFGPGIYGFTNDNADVDAFTTMRNDNISSLVVGAKAVVWLCKDYAPVGQDKTVELGQCQVFTGGTTPSLPKLGFDDRTSSVIVTAGKNLRSAVGMEAWADVNFSGKTQAFKAGGYDVADIANGVGNDAISSIKVRPGYMAVLCTNGISHARALENGIPTGAKCRLFTAGQYATMPAGYNDIVTYLNVLPVASNPALVGAYGPIKPWPYAAINQYLLADGRVMINEDQADDGNPSTGEYMIWNPADDTYVDETMFAKGANLFCSAFVHLPNGNLFAAATGGGGNTTNLTALFDSSTGRWQLAPKMIWKRYYPSAALTPNGSVLVAGGNDVFGKAYGQTNAAITTPEIFENWSWRELTNAKLSFSDNRGTTNDSAYWPWMQAAANGKMFIAGPDTRMRYIDPAGSGALSEAGTRDTSFRSYGSYAMFAPGQILLSGGSNSLASASVVSFDGVHAAVAPVSPMLYGRRQHNLTILSNGEVLVIGGNGDGAETYSKNAPVMVGEIWNPESKTWRAAADYQVSRQYHSTAMLIPDGRVLLAGSCSSGAPCERNSELFSPPYLFNADGSAATRPVITQVKDQWRYGEAITAAFNSSDVAKAHLIKLGAVTHATNFEQRLVPLAITANSSGAIRFTAPANANLAPPGHYMLVMVNAAGTPSVARTVQITNNVAPLGAASQSSTYGDNLFPAANALDGSTGSFSHTATQDRAATWTLQWSQDVVVEQIALHNRAEGWRQRLRDIKVSLYDASGRVLWTSGLLNASNALKSPSRLDIDLYRLGVGAVKARKLVVQRQPDPNLTGGPGDNADGVSTLTLSEVQVFAK